MTEDNYLISIKRKEEGHEPESLINLRISPPNWPRVAQALEVLVTENPYFMYEAWYRGRQVVNNRRE